MQPSPIMKDVKSNSHSVPSPVVLWHACLIAAFTVQLLMRYPVFG
ncbi:MAG: hypothetical protein PHO92_04835 [Candidatus Peribacteraceae bacterium]|nr:hypothetical protein [Candidatus Peribacteraceae bacterium]